MIVLIPVELVQLHRPTTLLRQDCDNAAVEKHNAADNTAKDAKIGRVDMAIPWFDKLEIVSAGSYGTMMVCNNSHGDW